MPPERNTVSAFDRLVGKWYDGIEIKEIDIDRATEDILVLRFELDAANEDAERLYNALADIIDPQALYPREWLDALDKHKERINNVRARN